LAAARTIIFEGRAWNTYQMIENLSPGQEVSHALSALCGPSAARDLTGTAFLQVRRVPGQNYDI
jgi:hypothetical protein